MSGTLGLDLAKVRRENIRWYLLLALNHSRPIDAHENILLATLRGIYTDCTPTETRRELDYLKDRRMVSVTKNPSGFWTANLTSLGVDIVEYTAEIRDGIARPEKYWAGSQ